MGVGLPPPPAPGDAVLTLTCSECGTEETATLAQQRLEAGEVAFQTRIQVREVLVDPRVRRSPSTGRIIDHVSPRCADGCWARQALEEALVEKRPVEVHLQALADALFVPGQSLHCQHWLVHHGLALMCRALQDFDLQPPHTETAAAPPPSTPTLSGEEEARRRSWVWLWAASELWALRILKGVTGERPFPELGKRMVSAGKALVAFSGWGWEWGGLGGRATAGTGRRYCP